MTARKPSRRLLFRVRISDCDTVTFRAGGPGGQNQNKRDTGVRITHPPSGAVGESREQRSQLQNKRAAWKRMGESQAFQSWARARAAGLAPIDEIVDRQMAPEHLTVETRRDGRWVREDTA